MEYLVPNSETLGTTNPETQCNQQIFTPVLKQEIENDMDEENSSGYDYNMSPQHVNYYDSKSHVLEEVKEELPGDEYPEADCIIDDKKLPENNILVNVKYCQRVENVNTELSLDIKEENDDKIYELTIKLEADDEKGMLDNAEGASVHYEVSVTPPGSQYKLCDKTFKNSSNLLQYNKEQIKTNTSGDNEIKGLHQCQYCSVHFNNHDDMLVHVSDVHKKMYPKCELCGKQFKSVRGLKCHLIKIHKHKKPPKGALVVIRKDAKCAYCDLDFKNTSIYKSHMRLCHPAKKITYKCGTCVKLFKTRHSLICHMKRTHYDFGRMFECWCGEQFRTPIHLSEHKRLQHTAKGKIEEYKCKDCDVVFSSERYLTTHVKKSHFKCGSEFKSDCGSEFKSDCGSELITSTQLDNRETRKHNRLSDTNNSQVQCDHCQRTFTNNSYLMKHIRRVHYDYGKVFKCWCGKEFRTPYHLQEHKGLHNYRNSKVQCDKCEKFYKNKFSLAKHKIKFHGEYGRVYKCWCGKEFRTPSELADHNSQQHDSKTECANNDKYQCVTCMSFCKTKNGLLRHIKRKHHDYGNKVFKCFCGKVYPTPYHLSSHKSMSHDGKNDETLTTKVQCDVCKKFYKSNRLLERHCKRMHCDYLFE